VIQAAAHLDCLIADGLFVAGATDPMTFAALDVSTPEGVEG